MNMSASQWSGSGCESGWTMYLDQSSVPRNEYQDFGACNVGGDYTRLEDEEEEDLSMVSDASSGPPHYFEDDEYCFQQFTKKGKSKKKAKEHARNQQFSYLDDTASSPVLSKKAINNESSMDHGQEFSQGSSATQFKGKSGVKKHHFGFFQSSHAEKSASKEPGGFHGRKWK